MPAPVRLVRWVAVRFLAVLVVVWWLRLRSGSVDTVRWTRGFECPVEERVEGISRLCFEFVFVYKGT